MISARLEVEIPFYDVDSCNVVWHGHYVKYLERARCKLLDQIGYSYQTMREDGYFFPVVDLHIRYAGALLFTQRCEIETTLVEWENRLKMRYLIRDQETGKRLTTATTTQVAVDLSTGNLVFECPQKLVSLVEKLL